MLENKEVKEFMDEGVDVVMVCGNEVSGIWKWVEGG